ncbi:rotamase superfamily PPIASE domain-containing protein (plasmid) [Rhizobium phaseoli]|uniref:peptidylprolyl isomerase n=1 Tax=Rhizobium phaseoli TaxID=396 RepID=UPI0007F05B2E|nr:rotamase superfamily PPIASE domain-containing protein [Rhizobium phaseoli]ANL76302.1 rotamase superfamily PPIASE domain-containing protein [Rhizobium phaseoli]ANL82659.1 rotamase superfamily PPIASE domain-containing protein [Rhizobium phaseoli]
MKLPPERPKPFGNSDGGEHNASGRLRRLVSEPLLHFAAAGALLFGGYHLLTPMQDGAASTNQIVLTKHDVRQLAISWLAQGRSTPTAEQVRGLVDQKVTQEILFREAVSLGLDRDDEVVKRRLAQKMDFLASDVAALQEPTDAELKAWFEKNSATFALPAHATFRHLYFSTDRHGKQTKEAAAAALTLIEGKSPDSSEVAAIGDPFMFQSNYGDATPDQMAKEFGPEFSKALFQLTPGKWAGPVKSGYGWHLVWVDSIEPGRIPNYAEVMPNVKAGWIDDKYREIKNSALQEMRSRYSIVVPPIEAADLQDLQVQPGFNLGLEVSAQ